MLLRTPIIMLIAALCTALAALAPVPAGAQSPQPTMDWRDLRPGMRGHGLTAFEGFRIERFEVEILGILTGMYPGSAMILARLDHEKLRGHGVYGGMSGSPVYIDGKLIGGVSHSWPDVLEPVVGIMPIDEIIKVLDAATEHPLLPSNESFASGTVAVSSELLRGMGIESPGGADTVELHPLSAPLAASTSDPLVLESLRRAYPGTTILPVSTVGAGGDRSTTETWVLQPGTPFMVTKVSGDMVLAAGGTVTMIDGPRFTGFAHAMMGLGACDVPVHAGYVEGLIPMFSGPFKLMGIRQEIAALRQDREAGISGWLGASARTLPISVRVHAGEYGGVREFSYHAHNDWRLVSATVEALLIRSAGFAARADGPMTLRAEWTLEFGAAGSLKRDFLASGNGGHITGLAKGIRDEIEALLNNPFAPEPLETLSIDLSFDRTRRDAEIESVWLPRTAWHPGEAIEGEVVARHWRGERQSHPFRMRLPHGLAAGEYTLFAGSAALRARIEGANTTQHRPPNSFAEYLANISPTFNGGDIHIVLYRREEAPLLESRALLDLPPTTELLLNEATTGSLPVEGATLIVGEQRLPLGGEAKGAARMTISVQTPSHRMIP